MADTENKENQEVKEEETVEGNEETGGADTQTAENQKEGESDEDVKSEAQKIADKMFAKKMKGMPTKEELKAFKEWQESQKTAEQKQSEKETEYTKAKSENVTLKQENLVLKANVNTDDVDYVVFKVSKMDGDFEENLEEFLDKNPKYLKNQEQNEKKSETTGTSVKKLSDQSESGVRAILKKKRPDLFKDSE